MIMSQISVPCFRIELSRDPWEQHPHVRKGLKMGWLGVSGEKRLLEAFQQKDTKGKNSRMVLQS